MLDPSDGSSPSNVVTRPPASPTITAIEAQSQTRSAGSIITSAAPRATSMCPQKSPNPRLRRVSRSIPTNASSRGPPSQSSMLENTMNASSSFRSLTCSSRPFHRAPPPRTASYRSPSAGALAIPRTDRPSTCRASSVAQIGTPSAKFLVPSIGSTIHIRSPAPSPCSSPITASAGYRAAIISRTADSTSRSAWVTGDRSGFCRTSNSPRKYDIEISAARSATSCAKESSCSNTARPYQPRVTRPARRAGPDEYLAPITDPDIDVQQLEPGKPFVFSATVEVRPRLSFEEADYTGIRVTKPAIDVTEEDIDEWIERLRERFAELEPVGRPVQQGDFVTVDLTVTRSGKRVEQASREDYLYFVGSGEVGEKLDVELAGAKP